MRSPRLLGPTMRRPIARVRTTRRRARVLRVSRDVASHAARSCCVTRSSSTGTSFARKVRAGQSRPDHRSAEAGPRSPRWQSVTSEAAAAGAEAAAAAEARAARVEAAAAAAAAVPAPVLAAVPAAADRRRSRFVFACSGLLSNSELSSFFRPAIDISNRGG